jgi:hypothetical protein
MSDMPYRLSNFAKPQFADSAFYKTDDKSDKTPAPLRGLIEQRLELGRLSQVLRWNGSPSMPKGLPGAGHPQLDVIERCNLLESTRLPAAWAHNSPYQTMCGKNRHTFIDLPIHFTLLTFTILKILPGS